MKHGVMRIAACILAMSGVASAMDAGVPVAETTAGFVEGTYVSGISTFKGIPFAAPPVGKLRWREPQPARRWDGVRRAQAFGPRCMQLPVFGDMNFRSDGMSEDCLYLNVWTPGASRDARLPVLVYFYGGGFVAGDGSEPRYDGENMARRGIVTVTVNYRLGVFGFLAHPDLSRESGDRGSGNYGLLDQAAALRWVRDNIAAFGGDPERVTIAGESAGSASVSGHVMSPLSRNLIAGAIGESGSFLGTLPPQDLAVAEANGREFAAHAGVGSFDDLRAMAGSQLLDAVKKFSSDDLSLRNLYSFPVTIDGHFFPDSPGALYASGDVADVPLLVGWNSKEMNYRFLFRERALTADNFAAVLEEQFGPDADEALKLYHGESPDELAQAATDLAGDLFIAFATWKWGEAHSTATSKPVYRYYYTRPRPAMRPEFSNAVAGFAGGIIERDDTPAPQVADVEGAVHSAEIEYAMGNLPSNRIYDWQPEDFRVSAVMQGYFANFVESGNPNGTGLPAWPAMNSGDVRPTMIIDVESRVVESVHEERYRFLDRLESGQ